MGQDQANRAVVPPINLSTNYVFDRPDQAGPFDYSRSANPTRQLLNEALADLEDGKAAISVATGMAAITLTLNALVPTGGRVLAQQDCYGGTWRLLDLFARQERLDVDFIDVNDPDQLANALDEQPAVVWLESPSNPLLRISDISAIASAAHAQQSLVVVDNTFCSPLLQHPLALGADLVVHSTTKFINGHSDVVGGAVVVNDSELAEHLTFCANALGLTASAFDSYLTLRGLRTLDARLRVHDENTRAIVTAIADHPALKALHYPGLPDHPGHELAAKQQSGFGSLVSLDLAGGWQAAQQFLDSLELFHLAESLGGVESLVCHPATMTHAGMTPQAQQQAGIGPGLVRLSIGVEHKDDLVADVTSALDRISL